MLLAVQHLWKPDTCTKRSSASVNRAVADYCDSGTGLLLDEVQCLNLFESLKKRSVSRTCRAAEVNWPLTWPGVLLYQELQGTYLGLEGRRGLSLRCCGTAHPGSTAFSQQHTLVYGPGCVQYRVQVYTLPRRCGRADGRRVELSSVKSNLTSKCE